MQPARISWEEADKVIKDLKTNLRFCIVPAEKKCIKFKIIAAGSYRRKKPTLKDVDLLVILPTKLARYKNKILKSVVINHNNYIKKLEPRTNMQGPLHSGYRAELKSGGVVAIDLFLIPEKDFHLHYFTILETELLIFEQEHT